MAFLVGHSIKVLALAEGEEVVIQIQSTEQWLPKGVIQV